MIAVRLPGFFSLLVAISITVGAAAPASANWQCVTYARHVSDIEIRGDAHSWWASAESIYARGNTPAPGAVMVLRPHGRMRLGHVATVREIVNSRQIRLNHANWSRRGMVESDVLAEDVSPNNDWSAVKIWHTPTGQLGITSYPVYGFIYPEGPGSRDADPAQPRLVMASAERGGRHPQPPRPLMGRAAAHMNEPVRLAARTVDVPQDLIGDLLSDLD